MTARITLGRHVHPHVPVTLPAVAVIIPAYREATHIMTVLTGIPPWVQFIIVVDDRSPDETASLVRGWNDPRLHLICHGQNQGVGGAMLTGYQAAMELGAEILVKMDGDNQMDPAYLRALIEPIIRGEADYAKGNRFLHPRQLRSMPPLRRLGNLGLSFLTKLASGYWGIFDPTNGYTALHSSLVPMLNWEAIDRRHFFESSMLLELSLLRAVVRDVPMVARYGNEVSSLSVRASVLQFPPKLLRGLVRRVWVHYFLRDFGLFALFLICGVALTLFGIIVGITAWSRAWHLEVATPTGTVMLAALPIILGIQFMIQAITLDIQSSPAQPLQTLLGHAYAE